MFFYDFSGFFPDFSRMFFTTFSGIFLRKNGLEYGITSETTIPGITSETTETRLRNSCNGRPGGLEAGSRYRARSGSEEREVWRVIGNPLRKATKRASTQRSDSGA